MRSIVLVLVLAACHGGNDPPNRKSETPIDPTVTADCARIWTHRVDWWMGTVGGTRADAERNLEGTKSMFASECPRWPAATRTCMIAAASSAAYTKCEQSSNDAGAGECAHLWDHRLDLEFAAGTLAHDRAQLAVQMKPTADVFLAACPGYSPEQRACLAAATSFDAFAHCH